MTKPQLFSAAKLNQIDATQGIIIDVRTKMEHAEKRLTAGHTLMTLDELKPTDFMMRQGLDKDFEVYILCRSGKRAAQAAEKFIQEGYKNVHVIEGGIEACAESGHKLEGYAANENISKDIKRPMSLERQVRITAGLIVVLGSLLALTLSSGFVLIPLFVGAGLMFAGITDRCGMALVLTKAPWNKNVGGGSCPIPAQDNSPKASKSAQGCK
jgi:rhodanese-related sulfurtransferase